MAGQYHSAISALSPTAYWPLGEAYGSTTFSDVSGNGINLTQEGTILAGMPGISPQENQSNSVCWAALGDGVASSATSLDFTAPTAMSFVCTLSIPPTNITGFIYTKSDAATTRGHYFILYPNTLEWGYLSDNSNRRKWIFPVPSAGMHHIAISHNGSNASAPVIYVDGVLQTVSGINNAGTPTALTTTGLFRLGGRSDGNFWNGFMQDAAFWSGTALTSNQMVNLWNIHQIVDRTKALPYIWDTDGGSADIGDIPSTAMAIYLHLLGRINLLGYCVTVGDDVTAPANRAILDYYGLNNIPLGAYQGTDCHVGGTAGTASRLIRDAFRPRETRAGYTDPVPFYTNILNVQANNSVQVGWGGSANSIGKFLNSSGSAVTLWNSKVKSACGISGVWPNSSDAASPPGFYPDAGRGESNFGGSDPDPIGAAEVAAAVSIINNTTIPIYWHGAEICGNLPPELANLIISSLPVNWTLANPMKTGMLSQTRTAWDPVGLLAGLFQEWYGVSNPLWTTVQIGKPSLVASGARVAQNTSSPGSSNNFYFVPNTSVLTITQWRTLMAMICDVYLVETNVTTRGFRFM